MTSSLPHGWSTKSLVEMTSVCTSGYWGRDAAAPGTTACRVIRNGDVGKVTRIGTDLPVRYFTEKEYARARVAAGDTILVTSGAYTGTVARIRPEDVCAPTVASNFVRLIRSSPEVDGPFLGHLLASTVAQEQLRTFVGGSAMPNLQVAAYERIRLPVPPLMEQRRIAAVLSAVDDATQKTRSVARAVDESKVTAARKLLARGKGQHGRKVQIGAGSTPVGWTVHQLDELGVLGEPVIITGPFGASLKSEHFRDSGVPVLTIQSLGTGEIVRKGLFFTTKEKANELRAYTVRPGDLVFSRVADVGRSVVIPEDGSGWVISSNLMRIRVDERRFDPRFIMYSVVYSPVVTRQLAGVIADGGRQIVSVPVLRRLLFPFPPLEEQRLIADALESIEARARAETRYAKGLEDLKLGLSNQLLAGRLRMI